MTGFFDHQDQARRNTRWLIVLMGVAVVGISLAFYVALVAMTLARSETGLVDYWQPQHFVLAFGGTLALVLSASALRSLSLRRGGVAVAEMLGARQVDRSSSDEAERRLVNVVEEMAIASGVPVPGIFVMDEEGINAFAAGLTTDDAVVSVTRGALEALSRDELQGVVAHEFGHILNGDMRLNIRLMGIVFGILCIALVGRIVWRVGFFSGNRRNREGGSLGMALLALGLLMVALGFIGQFFARIIKSAVSRQREYLADASAVQFTRNPQGIAGALKKIAGWDAGSTLQASRAEEASHLFFGDYAVHRLSSLFATHPPLRERIRRLEPHFAPELHSSPASQPTRGVLPGERAPASDSLASGFAGSPAVSSPKTSAESKLKNPLANTPAAAVAGSPGDEREARHIISLIPPALRDAAASSFSAEVVVFGLLLSRELEVRARQQEIIDSHGAHGMSAELRRLLPALNDLPPRCRIPLVELAAPALRGLTETQRRGFADIVHQLIQADEHVSVFEIVLAHTLTKRMWRSSTQPKRRRDARSVREVERELHLVLSLLVYEGHATSDAAERSYRAVRDAFASKLQLPDHPAKNGPDLLPLLPPALEKLSQSTSRVRELVVESCAFAVLEDEVVSVTEAELLRLICDSIDVPLPLFVDASPM